MKNLSLTRCYKAIWLASAILWTIHAKPAWSQSNDSLKIKLSGVEKALENQNKRLTELEKSLKKDKTSQIYGTFHLQTDSFLPQWGKALQQVKTLSDTLPKHQTVESIHIELVDGMINLIFVQLKSGGYLKNAKAPVFLIESRGNHRYDDLLSGMDENGHDIQAPLKSLLRYEQQFGLRTVPGVVNFSLTSKDTTFQLKEDMVVGFLDASLAIYTDLLAILQESENPLASTRFAVDIPLHRQNVKNSYFFWFNYVRPSLEYSLVPEARGQVMDMETLSSDAYPQGIAPFDRQSFFENSKIRPSVELNLLRVGINRLSSTLDVNAGWMGQLSQFNRATSSIDTASSLLLRDTTAVSLYGSMPFVMAQLRMKIIAGLELDLGFGFGPHTTYFRNLTDTQETHLFNRFAKVSPVLFSNSQIVYTPPGKKSSFFIRYQSFFEWGKTTTIANFFQLGYNASLDNVFKSVRTDD